MVMLEQSGGGVNVVVRGPRWRSAGILGVGKNYSTTIMRRMVIMKEKREKERN